MKFKLLSSQLVLCTFLPPKDMRRPNVECGKFSAPLCYSDVCTAPESVNKTIKVFVKRFPASDPETATNIWISGRNFQTMEHIAYMLHYELNETVNVYLMDARGSGKSTVFDCGMTTNDPSFDYSIDPAQVESCAFDLESKFGDPAAFSPTSAAHDLFNLISKLSNGANTFVYDTGYFTSDPSDKSFEMLYNLIVFSELWERPTPSMAELRKRFTDSVAGGGIYTGVPAYCAFSKEQSKVCDKYNFGKYEAREIIYKRDRYWNASITIPSQASVLVLSSKMDISAPYKYTKRLFESLTGTNKELITFETGSGATLFSTHPQLRFQSADTCGLKIIASYIFMGGVLDKLDKSCMDEMPTFEMIPSDFNEANFTNKLN
ncbi:uncharacterized protein PHALS_07371 [Plasmopara halstedii]|uniref:Uncharacterized protein n=1 Tax=Plasmopara halstedii TaxID=4781 RepID=A0A0P1B710_PLAHL|nr:uncharacterized protein PHALS_07371 [Plasmopara halstedii]CEG49617.1 hypothetical protein PHALS_07371 [Plasmopara halstedii]|eukprot:XP_024585986.1 hypothetical protein PHALS_07371 [Plasmopara halstedii]